LYAGALHSVQASNSCKNLQIAEGSKVSKALHLVGQKHLELLLFLGLLSCVAHMMPAIHEFLHSDC
jgi:hypothetical protein